jgi:hypothetical protein
MSYLILILWRNPPWAAGGLRPSTVAKAIDDRSNVSTSSANRLTEHLAAQGTVQPYEPP